VIHASQRLSSLIPGPGELRIKPDGFSRRRERVRIAAPLSECLREVAVYLHRGLDAQRFFEAIDSFLQTTAAGTQASQCSDSRTVFRIVPQTLALENLRARIVALDFEQSTEVEASYPT